VLIDRLATRLDRARARALVEEALERSGRAEAPDDPDDLLSFAKAHLIDDLVAALGAREVSGFLDDLRENARMISGVRHRDAHMRALVALVDGDAFRRASTARLLVARHLEVIVARKLEELTTAQLEPEVLILDHDEALSAALYIVVAAPRFRASVVLRTKQPTAARAMLERAGIERYEIIVTTAPIDVVSAAERLLDLGDLGPPSSARR